MLASRQIATFLHRWRPGVDLVQRAGHYENINDRLCVDVRNRSAANVLNLERCPAETLPQRIRFRGKKILPARIMGTDYLHRRCTIAVSAENPKRIIPEL